MSTTNCVMNYRPYITTASTTNVISGVPVYGVHDVSATIDFESVHDKIYKEIMQKLSRRPVIAHKCHSCGGTIEMDEEKHIFICPYCGTTYAVGTYMINDRGE